MNLVREINEYREEIENVNVENLDSDETEINEEIEVRSEEIENEESTQELNTQETNEILDDQVSTISIPIINLYEWIEKFITRESINIRRIRLEMPDIESDTIILKSINLTNPDLKELFLLKNTKKFIIPDLASDDMMCYRNGTIRVNIRLSDNIYTRCYIVSSGIHCFAMYKKTIIENEETREYFIPYFYTKIKNRNISNVDIEGFSQNIEDISNHIDSIIENDVNKENVMLLYKPFSKTQENITSNLDLIKYFNEKYSDAIDINHHLLIDNILLKIFSN